MSSSFKSKKEEEDFEYNFNRHFGALLNLVALAIIISIIVFFFNNYKKNEAPKSFKEISQIDTLSIGVNLNLKDTASIIKFNEALNKQINNINQLKSDIEKSDEIKKDDIKFYFSIIGFILAIVGFFGFKSIHDSKEIAIKNAIDEAKTASKNIITDETDKIISEKLQDFQIKLDEVGQNYSDLKDSLAKIYELETIISDLKIRIDSIENNYSENEDSDTSVPSDSQLIIPSNDSSDGDKENFEEDFNGKDEFF